MDVITTRDVKGRKVYARFGVIPKGSYVHDVKDCHGRWEGVWSSHLGSYFVDLPKSACKTVQSPAKPKRSK